MRLWIRGVTPEPFGVATTDLARGEASDAADSGRDVAVPSSST